MSSVKEIDLKAIRETDGSIVIAEAMKEVPFLIKRIFCISDVPVGETRGEHASKSTDFFYICLRGSLKIETDDGREKKTYKFDSSDKGLFLPKKTWMKIYDFSPDAILLTLASEAYCADDYYENYDVFIAEKNLL